MKKYSVMLDAESTIIYSGTFTVLAESKNDAILAAKQAFEYDPSVYENDILDIDYTFVHATEMG